MPAMLGIHTKGHQGFADGCFQLRARRASQSFDRVALAESLTRCLVMGLFHRGGGSARLGRAAVLDHLATILEDVLKPRSLTVTCTYTNPRIRRIPCTRRAAPNHLVLIVWTAIACLPTFLSSGGGAGVSACVKTRAGLNACTPVEGLKLQGTILASF